MARPLKIAFVSSECSPFAKVGGLADVVGSLPKTLQVLGVDARIVAPRYESIDLNLLKAKPLGTIQTPFGGKFWPVEIYQAFVPFSTVTVYLLDQPFWISQGQIYETGFDQKEKNYLTKRFLFFSKAALAAMRHIGFQPDILHAHDWPTANLPNLVQAGIPDANFFRKAKTLLTIHNLNYQNFADRQSLEATGLVPEKIAGLSKSKTNPNYFNLLAAGILATDCVNTVSPTYAKEIMRPEYSHGLGKILAERKNSVIGILNGIDTEYFNPKEDRYIAAKYDSKSLEKKASNKIALQKKLNLEMDGQAMVAGTVTRLSEQKGLELITGAIEKSQVQPIQYIILGQGETKYVSAIKRLQKQNPKKLAFIDGYDSHLAKMIYAGSDVFLMPSKFEPCGLTQLIAMRYGTLPLVRDTGGLHDTVIDFKKRLGYGFVFKNFDTTSFSAAIDRAYAAFQNRALWKMLIRRAMKTDFSWNRSAKQYLRLYQKLSKTK